MLGDLIFFICVTSAHQELSQAVKNKLHEKSKQLVTSLQKCSNFDIFGSQIQAKFKKETTGMIAIMDHE